MRRKRPYTEPDRIKERIVTINKKHHEGCRHDCDEETMICKKCDEFCIRFEPYRMPVWPQPIRNWSQS